MGSKNRAHAVCIPFAAQGHITPMLQLAKLLHSIYGFHITFVNTEYNQRRLISSKGDGAALAGVPGFEFVTIPDGLPPSSSRTDDVPALCESILKHTPPHIRSLLEELSSPASTTPPVTCAIFDGVMSSALDAAAEFDFPVALFWTTSACGFMGYLLFQDLVDRGMFPLKSEEDLSNGYLETPVKWAAGMTEYLRLKDLPSFIRSTDPEDFMFKFVRREAQRTASLPSAVILNTFEELEHDVLNAMRNDNIVRPPLFTIGPLPLVLRQIPPESPLKSIGANLWREDKECLEWLKGRRPSSVVYVNFGSITMITNAQLLEFAWGLANSGHDFVWVIRSDLVKGDSAVLPNEFIEETKSRGLLLSWCAQDQVLEDPSIGVFLTHCGWNSTIESISHGVPMISWPFFAEQQTNCRYACMEWGVSTEIDQNVRREEVTELIKEAMEGEKGKEMRRRAAEWKEKAVTAAQAGGAATMNLERLVKDVLLSKKHVEL